MFGIDKKYFRTSLVGLILLVVALSTMVLMPDFVRSIEGDHPDSETPGSRRAVIFSPFGPLSPDDRAGMTYVRARAEEQNYAVTELFDPTESGDDDPGDATAANFLTLSGAGLIYVVSHGDTDNPATPVIEPNWILVEAYATSAARNAAFATYGAPFVPGDLIRCDNFNGNPLAVITDHVGNRTFGICITEQGVMNHFVDNDTIVHLGVCRSFNFRDEFHSREFFGYNTVEACPTIRADAERLWGRMHGVMDAGRHRAAAMAFAQGGFTPHFSHEHRAGDLDTVLSPAVRENYPNNVTLLAPTTVKGRVVFDAKMDTAVDPATVISANGCDAEIRNPVWTSPFRIDFSLKVKKSGTVTLAAQQAQARAERDFKNNLDGNQDPAGSIHEGPNRDDFVWQMGCREGWIRTGWTIITERKEFFAGGSAAVIIALLLFWYLRKKRFAKRG